MFFDWRERRRGWIERLFRAIADFWTWLARRVQPGPREVS